MNRKNTILIAVMINAGLLAVLLIVALTTQEEALPNSEMVADTVHPLPKFDDRLSFADPLPEKKEIPLALLPEVPEEILVHKLPAIVPEPTFVPVSAPIVCSPLSEVTVKKGDSLERIAKANRTSVDEIIKINHLPNTVLKVGQILKIPTEKSIASAPKAVETKKSAEIGPEYYTMKVGDNTWAIAMKHHMKVDELLRLNGLNEDKARKLKPGDRLRIR